MKQQSTHRLNLQTYTYTTPFISHVAVRHKSDTIQTALTGYELTHSERIDVERCFLHNKYFMLTGLPCLVDEVKKNLIKTWLSAQSVIFFLSLTFTS